MLGKVNVRTLVLMAALTIMGLVSLASGAAAQGCKTISGVA